MPETRIRSGIIDLDEKMEGGYFQGSVNLITGKTGTGKTAFCFSFLYEGALDREPGFYVTTEQREQDLKKDMAAMFDWDIAGMEKKKLVHFLSIKPIFTGKDVEPDKMNKLIKLYIFDIFEKIRKGIKTYGSKRVVIDSISIIEMFIKDEYLSRTVLMQLIEILKENNVTALIAGTIPETSEALSGGGIIEYIADSVIKLDFVPVAEEFKRTLTIRKMRRTDHSTLIHPFDITKSGLKVIEIK